MKKKNEQRGKLIHQIYMKRRNRLTELDSMLETRRQQAEKASSVIFLELRKRKPNFKIIDNNQVVINEFLSGLRSIVRNWKSLHRNAQILCITASEGRDIDKAMALAQIARRLEPEYAAIVQKIETKRKALGN